MVFALAAAARGQTKVSSTQHCSKPEKEYTIDVGDRPNHAFAIGRMQCTWAKLEIAGVEIREENDTCFAEVSRKRSRFNCYAGFSAANGDRYFGRWEGFYMQKDGTEDVDAKLSIVAGPSKLKGLKGRWMCKTTYATDGSSDSQCEGEYELPR
jgi:hypothetical protein